MQQIIKQMQCYFLSLSFFGLSLTSAQAGYFFNTANVNAPPQQVRSFYSTTQADFTLNVFSKLFASDPQLEDFHEIMQIYYSRIRDTLTNQQYHSWTLARKLVPFRGMEENVALSYKTFGHKLAVFKNSKANFMIYLNEHVEWCKVNNLGITDYSFNCSVAYRLQAVLNSLPLLRDAISNNPTLLQNGQINGQMEDALAAVAIKLRDFDHPTNGLLRWYFNSGVLARDRNVLVCNYQKGINC